MDYASDKPNMHEPAVFSICIQGELDERWLEYFGAQSITTATDAAGNVVTEIISDPMDQGALVGLINRLNALGIVVISMAFRSTG